MDDLHEFLQGQFAEFAGHDAYETQLTIWCHRRQVEVRQADREWKARNSDRERDRTRLYHIEHRDEILARHKANAEKQREAVRRFRERNRDAVRAYDRRRKAKRQEARAA